MTNIELAKKALMTITERTFPCFVFCTKDGYEKSGWFDTVALTMKADQIRYLIGMDVNVTEVMEDMPQEVCDLKQIYHDLALCKAFPYGDLYPETDAIVPDELIPLYDRICVFCDDIDDSDLENITNGLRAIKAGDYTFHCNLCDPDSGEVVVPDAIAKVHLTAREAISTIAAFWGGLLDKLKIGYDCIEDNFVNYRIATSDITLVEGYFKFGGHCAPLERFITGWRKLVCRILRDEIPEEQLEHWIEEIEWV